MTTTGKIGVAVASLIAAAGIATGVYFALNQADQDAGVDVSGTNCDAIASARQAVADEYSQRQDAAEAAYETAMEAASDAYWDEYNRLEKEKWDCETEALLADPCKDAFEESHRLAQIAIANPTDANVDARTEAVAAWDACRENPPEEDTYEGKKAKCEAAFTAGVAAAQTTREQSEAQAAQAKDTALQNAETQLQQKNATLAAIEKECNKPPTTTELTTGGITTGSTGTEVQSGSAACSGNFAGYDPEIQGEINRLTSLYNQAVAGGKYEGLGGANALSAKINEKRQEMAAGPKKCSAASDCGDTTPVCCSGTQVGKVICSDGVCANELTDCEEDEICAGDPAACISASTGAESTPISISASHVIGTPCKNTIQIINMRPKTNESKRFEIVGNIPDWLTFSPPGAAFPQDVQVDVDCAGLEARGPGVYTASGSITVYNAENALINTVPLSVTYTVTGILEDEGDDDGDDDTDDEEITTGGSAGTPQVALDVRLLEFTYNHAKPLCPLPLDPVTVTAPEGSTWHVMSDLPVWLRASQTQGSVNDPIQFNFPCQLNQYKDQTQSTNVMIEVRFLDTSIDPIELGLDVEGNFTNF